MEDLLDAQRVSRPRRTLVVDDNVDGADARPEDQQRAIEAGFNANLAKPPTIEQIEETIACAGAAVGQMVGDTP